ncbi:phosphate ABC transporter substrate-binding protein PstS [Nocardioidaceae bacterium]|nr:phosphate ABC transporter substrate-binding protein PstS [Nocardioidaceae bacterium]
MRSMRTPLHRAAVVGAALSLSFVTACSAGNAGGEGDTGGPNAAPQVEGLSGTLNGAGASTQEAAMGAWSAGFQTANPDVQVNYDPVGSGGGRESFVSGGVDFAGSDAPLEDEELATAQERCGGSVIEVPSYVSPIALVFNLEGVDSLDLSPEAIAGIFAGEITQWDDPAIAETNPNVDLPSNAITPVHRADDSGTTENFTEYLDAVAPDTWTFGVVETWPLGGQRGGSAAQGTSGIIDAVSSGANTIGYADASQAGDLSVANVGVGGEFVEPSAEAAANILEASPRVEGRDASDIVFELDRQTEEAGTYPIVLTSYILACPQYDDQETADLVKGYVGYVLSDAGQQTAAENAGSAPLPQSLQDEAEGIVESITAAG